MRVLLTIRARARVCVSATTPQSTKTSKPIPIRTAVRPLRMTRIRTTMAARSAATRWPRNRRRRSRRRPSRASTHALSVVCFALWEKTRLIPPGGWRGWCTFCSFFQLALSTISCFPPPLHDLFNDVSSSRREGQARALHALPAPVKCSVAGKEPTFQRHFVSMHRLDYCLCSSAQL